MTAVTVSDTPPTSPARGSFGSAGGRTAAGLALLLIAAGLVRMAYLAEVRHDPRHRHPGLEPGLHLAWAESAATGRWEPRTREAPDPLCGIPKAPFVQPPGYPTFLTGLYRLFGVNRAIPLIAQLALGLWVVLLTWFAAHRWVAPRAAWLAALVAGLHWSAVYYGAEFLDAGLLTALIACFLVGLALLGERLVARVPPAGQETPPAASSGAVLPLALAVGLAAGLVAIVRPAVDGVVVIGGLWLLATVWIAGMPSLRADVLRDMAPKLPDRRPVDVSSDLLLASREPSRATRCRVALVRLPSALRRSAVALLGLAAGALLAVAPVAWHNWRTSGFLTTVGLTRAVQVLAGALPEYEGVDDGDYGWGHRLDRTADYASLAEIADTRDPRKIARHLRRKRAQLVARSPESLAFSAVRRLQLFWGPLEVGSASVVEFDRAQSRILRWLPLPFSLVSSLALLGLAFCAVPRSGGRARPTATAHGVPAATVARLFPALIAILLGWWTWRHLPLLAAGLWRQPMLPWVATLAGLGVEEFILHCRGRNRREIVAWLAALASCWLIVGQNAGGYVPNRPKWFLDRGLALEWRGEFDAAEAAFRAALMVTPSMTDPATGIRHGDGGLERRDVIRFQKSGALAAAKLARTALDRGARTTAAAYYQLAAGLDVRRGEPLYNLGTLLLAEHRAEDAALALRDALARDPALWPARYPLAQALYRLGRYTEARDALDDLLKVHPDHRAARNLQALLGPEP